MIHPTEAVYRSLFDDNPLPLWFLDLQSQRFLAVNEAAVQRYGYSREEFLSMALPDLCFPEDRTVFQAPQSSCGTQAPGVQGSSGIEYVRHRKKDGSPLFADAAHQPSTFEGCPAVFVSIHDVTERVLAEETLNRVGSVLSAEAERVRAEREARESHDRLIAITDAVPALISLIDKEGFYRFNNHAYEQWFDQPPSGVEGRHMREVLGEDAWKQVRPYLVRALAGERVDYESQLSYKHAGPRWVRVSYIPQRDAAGEVQSVVALVTDVTEQQARERTLNFLIDLNEALRQLHDPKEVMATSTRMLGDYLQVSRCAYAPMDEDGMGFSIEGDYSPHVPSSKGHYQISAFGRRAGTELRAGKTFVMNNIEEEPARENLTGFRYLRIAAIVCTGLVKGGQLVALMAVHQDAPRIWKQEEIALIEMVSERCWAHIEQVNTAMRLAERAREVQRLNERLTRAMRETHHRVKNNLQVVAGMIDMQMLEHEESRQVPLGGLERLATHVRILAVVHDILTKHLQEEEVDQRLSVKEVLERLLPLLKQSLTDESLHSEIEDLYLTGKQCTALALITNELVSNALKHGGNKVAVSFTRNLSAATLKVEDNGRGFPLDFDPIRSTNTGLQLVEGVAHTDLSGKVLYQNKEVGGARVLVTFPIALPESVMAGQPLTFR